MLQSEAHPISSSLSKLAVFPENVYRSAAHLDISPMLIFRVQQVHRHVIVSLYRVCSSLVLMPLDILTRILICIHYNGEYDWEKCNRNIFET